MGETTEQKKGNFSFFTHQKTLSVEQPYVCHFPFSFIFFPFPVLFQILCRFFFFTFRYHFSFCFLSRRSSEECTSLLFIIYYHDDGMHGYFIHRAAGHVYRREGNKQNNHSIYTYNLCVFLCFAFTTAFFPDQVGAAGGVGGATSI